MTSDVRSELVEKLRKAVSARAVDGDQVLALALELLQADPDQVRFTVDASHISRLGLELVAKQQTAVAELVKNAYDADATQVRLTFRNSEAEGGSLEVSDDGSGMTRDDLINGFMRISTAQKQTDPHSAKYRRARAGRKGIGRFAAQRLGRRLTVVTQTVGATGSLKLEIDWAQFLAGRDIQSIRNSVQIGPPRGGSGTTLLIEGLRDKWSDDEIRAAYQAIAELVQPFPIAVSFPIAGSVEDPGFEVVFSRSDGSDPAIVADQWTAYLQFAQASVTGSVDRHGKATYRIESRQFGIDERVRSKVRYRYLESARFRAFYYIPPEIPKQSRAFIGLFRQISG